ncbi:MULTISPECIES: efflux RND transporter periplasmic adaptor subunit [Rhodomicrobium]|uniref:efflux RND transporter periplasmic adaptor subunit n=1 Tax=Rhodomicrobium TaxID=1068 RepID=UPI000B4BCC2C|nr:MULTISPECIES: efflux RND transporter periplasmic adaptor subunit [Rhodomicrobium]
MNRDAPGPESGQPPQAGTDETAKADRDRKAQSEAAQHAKTENGQTAQSGNGQNGNAPMVEPEPAPPPKGVVRGVGLFALLALALAVGYGVWGKMERSAAAVDTQQQQQAAVPIVRTSAVESVTAPRTFSLPGTTQAFDSAVIFARATGYVSKRVVDIGSKVKAGDTLAIIAAPDLDQQLIQARAQVVQLQATIDQAQANLELADVTNKRTAKLVTEGWNTKQQGDVDRLTYRAQEAALSVAQANLKVQQAAVARLEELTKFENVVAPFDGVVTSRQIDTGSLVTADISSGTSMFTMDRTNVLRVLVYVPQDAVFNIKDGDEAEVTVPEQPGRIFKGKIARNAGSLQAGTRTLLTEVDIDNADDALRAGVYCTVKLSVPRLRPTIIIPSQAVIFDEKGLSAAVFDDGVARLRSLDVLRDDGAKLEIRAGLNPGDTIILSPPVGIRDGMRVEAAPAEGAPAEKVASEAK